MILHCLFFIGGILWLRYLRWAFYLDIKLVSTKIYNNIINNHIFLTIIIILLFLNLFLIFIHVKHFFIKQLMKRHLYVYFKLMYKTLLINIKDNKNLMSTVIIHHLYVRFINNLQGYWSYKALINRFIFYTFIRLYCFIKNTDRYPTWMGNSLINIISNIPRSLSIIIIIYEYKTNNGILHYIFYYLPFYFIIELYKSLSNFLRNMDQELNRIIYERYYEEDNVIYANTTDKEDEYILLYIKRGFRSFVHDVKTENKEFDTIWNEKSVLLDFPIIFIQQRRFIKSKEDPNIFENNYTGENIDNRQTIVLKYYK